MSIEGNFNFSFNATAQNDRASEAQNARAGGSNGGGWLLAIALTLGKIADSMGERMLGLAEKIDTLQAKQADDPKAVDAETGDGLTELNAQLQVLGQQLGQMLQMLSTIVKTIGEGNKDLARKQ